MRPLNAKGLNAKGLNAEGLNAEGLNAAAAAAETFADGVPTARTRFIRAAFRPNASLHCGLS